MLLSPLVAARKIITFTILNSFKYPIFMKMLSQLNFCVSTLASSGQPVEKKGLCVSSGVE